jgi:predicted transposase/invertase (TIGR01784 family)
MQRLRPMNDFIFKKLFGEEGQIDNLKAFLNAILYKNDEKIVGLEILNDKELTLDNIKDKKGIIDVLAKLGDGTQINIEVQLIDQDNMDKRTLFYWARIYNRGIVKGEDYSSLNKVITINILNFDYIKLKDYHTSFSLREDKNNDYILTDVLEIHFIEMPKFKKLENKDVKNDKLQRWMMFLRNDISEGELNEIMDIDGDIKRAEERLEYLSADPQTQELYFEREKAIHDQANIYSTGVRRGREEGIAQGIELGLSQGRSEGIELGRSEGMAQGREEEKISIVKTMLENNVDINIISISTGLTIEEINELKN